MRRTLFTGLGLAAILAATVAAPAQGSGGSAEVAAGEAFCAAKDRLMAEPIGDVVTPSLATEIRKAIERNDVIARAHPDEKPPLGDGVPFQSYPDVSPKCEVGTVTGAGPGATVEIRHVFPDEPSAGFADRLVLGAAATGEDLAVDDVLYGAEGDNGSLRRALVEMFE